MDDVCFLLMHSLARGLGMWYHNSKFMLWETGPLTVPASSSRNMMNLLLSDRQNPLMPVWRMALEAFVFWSGVSVKSTMMSEMFESDDITEFICQMWILRACTPQRKRRDIERNTGLYDVAEKEKYQLIGECCLRKANVWLSGGNRGVGNMLGDSTWRNEMSKGVVIRN